MLLPLPTDTAIAHARCCRVQTYVLLHELVRHVFALIQRQQLVCLDYALEMLARVAHNNRLRCLLDQQDQLPHMLAVNFRAFWLITETRGVRCPPLLPLLALLLCRARLSHRS